jgi:hypothetical protein
MIDDRSDPGSWAQAIGWRRACGFPFGDEPLEPIGPPSLSSGLDNQPRAHDAKLDRGIAKTGVVDSFHAHPNPTKGA